MRFIEDVQFFILTAHYTIDGSGTTDFLSVFFFVMVFVKKKPYKFLKNPYEFLKKTHMNLKKKPYEFFKKNHMDFLIVMVFLLLAKKKPDKKT